MYSVHNFGKLRTYGPFYINGSQSVCFNAEKNFNLKVVTDGNAMATPYLKFRNQIVKVQRSLHFILRDF